MLQFKEIKLRFLSHCHCHYHVFIKASTASLCNRRSEIRKRQTWKWRKKCWLLKLWKFDLVAMGRGTVPLFNKRSRRRKRKRQIKLREDEVSPLKALKIWACSHRNKHRSLCLCINVLKTTDQHSLTWHGWNVIVSFLKTKKIQKEPRMDSRRPFKQTFFFGSSCGLCRHFGDFVYFGPKIARAADSCEIFSGK